MKPTLSRRASLRNLGGMGALTALGSALFSRRAGAVPVKAECFALVGDRYHNSDYIRSALGRTLVREAGLSIDFTDEVSLLTADTLRGYKMLIVFRDGMIWPDGYLGSYPGYGGGTAQAELKSVPPLPDLNGEPRMWMQPEQGRAVKEFVLKGGSAFFFHNNSHVSLSSKDYRDVEGAIYTGHPPVRSFWVRITNRDHPITRGVQDFLVTDEQHYVTYDKDPKHVLMRSENEDGLDYNGQGSACEAGWAYEYGKGRVCFMAPGHMISALWNREYVKLQQNAVSWLLRKT